MLFRELVEGNIISLSEGNAFTVTSIPEEDPVTGSLFVTGLLKDGTESRYFATEETLVTVVVDGD
ncbi:TPA: hypothetical protein ACHOYZ_003588 [Klebsiella michiganensis]